MARSRSGPLGGRANTRWNACWYSSTVAICATAASRFGWPNGSVSGVGVSFELAFLAERSQPKISVTVPATITTRIKTRRTLEPNLRWAAVFIEADISVGLLCHGGSWRLLVDRRKVMIVT